MRCGDAAGLVSGRREPPRCSDALQWLRANGHSLAPVTGTDARALKAFAHLLDLYALTGSSSVVVALAVCVAEMQPKIAPLARELIAWALDWGDRDRMWPDIEAQAEHIRRPL